MNYSTNYNLNKPERNEQFNLDDWNNNTDAIDTAMNTNKTNIANNASNISTILTGLSTVNTSDANSVYYKLMKLIYPVGSLYWSSKDTDPSTLFGGTWVQIKDRFVLACGDTYNTTGATGGASTVTLSVSNMPSHNHTFTPSGDVSSHFHTINNGNTSTSGTTATAGFRGVAVTSSGMSANSIGQFSIGLTGINATDYWTINNVSGNVSRKKTGNTYGTANNYPAGGTQYDTAIINVSHTHNVTASGYLYGKTDNTQPSFTGTQGTTSSDGSGTAFSILPPYVVKYCWERTA